MPIIHSSCGSYAKSLPSSATNRNQLTDDSTDGKAKKCPLLYGSRTKQDESRRLVCVWGAMKIEIDADGAMEQNGWKGKQYDATDANNNDGATTTTTPNPHHVA